jgi:hypothetical protein
MDVAADVTFVTEANCSGSGRRWCVSGPLHWSAFHRPSNRTTGPRWIAGRQGHGRFGEWRFVLHRVWFGKAQSADDFLRPRSQEFRHEGRAEPNIATASG